MDFAGRQLDLSYPRVMGVVNTTPDSFSDGGTLYQGKQLDLQLAMDRARNMALAGAAIIDIGGESTRPGAETITVDQEMDRVLPLVEAITRELDVVVSVDTSSPQLMREAALCGAGMINDVRALLKEGALEAAAQSGLPICLMHMQGEPGTMQEAPDYTDVVAQVCSFLRQRMDACEAVGIDRGRLMLDPGFGFGKNDSHNLCLLRELGKLTELGRPVLVGLSRKSMIGRLIGRAPGERLPASLALALLAAERGASIIRTHDVAATQDALAMWLAMEKQGN
jgi:dihydropteroate synthase